MLVTPSTWPVQDAKARFSELLDVCHMQGPQTITRRGAATAVLVPIEEWQRLKASAKPTLKELLLNGKHRFELELPPRGQFKHREPPTF